MELFCFASAAILLITQKEVEGGLISWTAAGNGAFVKFPWSVVQILGLEHTVREDRIAKCRG